MEKAVAVITIKNFIRLVAVAITSLISWYGLYPVIHPDIIIEPENSTFNISPFKTKWIIKNDGWDPVIDLEILINPREVTIGNSKAISGPDDYTANISWPEGKIGRLESKETTTISVPIEINGDQSQIRKIDIAFTIRYKALYFPVKVWNRKQSFQPEIQKDGSWFWRPYNIKSKKGGPIVF
jgi:hypothetical protein